MPDYVNRKTDQNMNDPWWWISKLSHFQHFLSIFLAGYYLGEGLEECLELLFKLISTETTILAAKKLLGVLAVIWASFFFCCCFCHLLFWNGQSNIGRSVRFFVARPWALCMYIKHVLSYFRCSWWRWDGADGGEVFMGWYRGKVLWAHVPPPLSLSQNLWIDLDGKGSSLEFSVDVISVMHKQVFSSIFHD